MNRISVFFAGACIAVGLAACNQNTAQTAAPAQTPAPGSANEVVSAVKDATAGAVGVITAEMTTTSQGFVNAAAVSDMYEVQAGKIALARSKSAEIKNFAQMMIDAHTMSTEKLKGILTFMPAIQPPAGLDSRRQGLLDDLNGAKDEDFDVRYLNQQVNAHNEALILVRGFAKDGDNAQLKQFAADIQPVVQMHLDMATQLDKSGADQAGAKPATP